MHGGSMVANPGRSLGGICRGLAGIGDLRRRIIAAVEAYNPVVGVGFREPVLVAVPAPPFPGQLVAVGLVLPELVLVGRPDIETLVDVDRPRAAPERYGHDVASPVVERSGYPCGEPDRPALQDIHHRRSRAGDRCVAGTAGPLARRQTNVESGQPDGRQRVGKRHGAVRFLNRCADACRPRLPELGNHRRGCILRQCIDDEQHLHPVVGLHNLCGNGGSVALQEHRFATLTGHLPRDGLVAPLTTDVVPDRQGLFVRCGRACCGGEPERQGDV